MSYMEFDPTNQAAFENFVSKQQQQRNRTIKWVIVGGLIIIGLYFIFKKPAIRDEEDILVS